MRVINAASRELAKVRSEADELRRALQAAQATSAGLGAARTGGLEKFGKNLQWTGELLGPRERVSPNRAITMQREYLLSQ